MAQECWQMKPPSSPLPPPCDYEAHSHDVSSVTWQRHPSPPRHPPSPLLSFPPLANHSARKLFSPNAITTSLAMIGPLGSHHSDLTTRRNKKRGDPREPSIRAQARGDDSALRNKLRFKFRLAENQRIISTLPTYESNIIFWHAKSWHLFSFSSCWFLKCLLSCIF